MKIKRIVSYIITSFILTVVMASCAGGSIGNSSLPPLRSDERFANSQGVYDTEKYYYFIAGRTLIRYNKQTKSSEDLSEYAGTIAYVTNDILYYTDTSSGTYELCKIDDSSAAPEALYELSSDEIYFLNDKYVYSVSRNGSVSRGLNSADKYYDSLEVIYKGDGRASEVSLYKDYIYYINENKELIRVPLKNGDGEVIADNIRVSGNRTNKFYFTGENGDQIVYVTSDDRLFSCDLDGSNTVEYPSDADNVYVVNNYIYFNDSMRGGRIPVGNNDANAIDSSHMTFCSYDTNYVKSLSDVGTGVMNLYKELYDYDGNKIGW